MAVGCLEYLGPSTQSCERKVMEIQYERPEIEDFGSIADHTFDNPGRGDKSGNTTFETDKWGEYSHPFAGS